MKMKRFTLLLTFLCIGMNTIVHAQLSTNEKPVSFSSLSSSLESIDSKIMPMLDMKKIEAEDMEDEEYDMPPRFGYSHIVSFDLHNSGTWSTMSNGDKLWQLRIICPNALSINLLYDKFWIPEGGKLFIYSSDKKYSIGAFTSRNNSGDRNAPQGFASGLIFSDSIILEYYQPNNVDSDAIISISRVVHGYRYIGAIAEIMGLNHSCDDEVNVNCPEGQNWQNEKKAVALVVVDGERWCTGSLIATTSYDEKPYLLTADHCLMNKYSYKYDAVNAPNLTYWSFLWNYESPGCSNVNYEPSHYTTTGATVVANKDTNVSDFALLRLNEDPRQIQGYTPYYLGWDRTGNSGNSGVCIHHPRGDIKKISTYSTSPISTNWLSPLTNPNGNYWMVSWSSTANGYGITEHGSSGSALINSNHRIIGQLHGGYSDCNKLNDPDWYGKFSVSWTGNNASDNRRRLDYWLDSIGSNQTTLDGNYPIKIVGADMICHNGQGSYSVSNLPSGYTVTWSSSNPLSVSLQTSGNNCFLTHNYIISHKVTLTATLYRGSQMIRTVTKNVVCHGDIIIRYSQAATSNHPAIVNQLVDNSRVIMVTQNVPATITSANFLGMNVSCNYSSVASWSYDGNQTITFTYPSTGIGPTGLVFSASGSPNCNDFQVTALPYPSGQKKSILVNTVGNRLELSIVPSSDADNEQTDKNLLWTLNVYEVSTGRKIFSQDYDTSRCTVDISGWKQGVYILQAVVGDEITYEKIKI